MALLQDGRTVTYATLAADLRRVVGALGRFHLAPGRLVSIVQSEPYRQLLLLLGLDRLGLAVFQVPPGKPSRVILPADTVLMTDDAGTAANRVLQLSLLDDHWWRNALSAPDISPPASTADPDAPIMLLRSSGTTGTPKSMLVTRRMMQARIRQRRRLLHLDRRSRYLVTMPFNVAGIYYAITACLRLGATIVLPSGPTSWQDFGTWHISHATLLPLHLRRLLASMSETATPREELTLCLIGARLPSALRQEALDRLCGIIVSVYSSNEAGTICSVRSDGTGDAVPGVVFEITNPTDRPDTEEGVGRIRVKGTGLIGGYLGHDNDLSAFHGGWFNTGDLGRIKADGRLIVLGRADDVVNLGGIKRSCEEVEDIILRRLALRDVAVFTAEDPYTGQVLMVCAVASAPIDVTEATRICVAMSGGPVSMRLFETLPRTEHGKLQRHLLRKMM